MNRPWPSSQPLRDWPRKPQLLKTDSFDKHVARRLDFDGMPLWLALALAQAEKESQVERKREAERSGYYAG